MAIDHGMFSFIDVRHGEWPVVLLTNPKPALFFNPSKENLESMLQSSHIRCHSPLLIYAEIGSFSLQSFGVQLV